jgi:hypothetical protein
MQVRWAVIASVLLGLCLPAAIARAQERPPGAPTSTGSPGAGASSDEVAQRARDLLADDRYQKNRPGAEPLPRLAPRSGDLDPDGGSSGATGRPGDAGKQDPLADHPPAPASTGKRQPEQGFGDGPGYGSEPRVAPPPRAPESGAANLFGLIVLSLLGVVLIVLLALGVTALFRNRAPKEDPAAAEDQESDEPARARVLPLGEVETLAMAGRYEDAIHALFHRAVRRLAARGSLAVADEMTGREVLRSAAVDDGARAALGDLVLAVEISVFGGRTLERADYDRCVASYQRIGLGS